MPGWGRKGMRLHDCRTRARAARLPSRKKALNDLLRAGADPSARPTQFRTAARHLGVPTVNLDRAIQLAGELEDEEMVRQMRTGR